MDKAELIEAIRELNFTASVDFLSQFNQDQLEQYFEHLLEVNMTQLTATSPVGAAN